MPSVNSSQSTRAGSLTSARASLRRRRCGSPSVATRSLARVSRPTVTSRCEALAMRASLSRPATRSSRALIRLSRTVRASSSTSSAAGT